MKNQIFLYTAIALIIGLSLSYFSNRNFQPNQNQPTTPNQEINRQNCLSDQCLLVENLDYPTSELSQEVKNALDEAINDEYKALATYEKVIEKFGKVRPFIMIKGAEEQHIASLKAIYDKYGLEAPINDWDDKVGEAPATLKEACQIGVEAEVANAKLYQDKLIPTISSYEDISLVFNNLMTASQEKHLPAFERCN